MLAVPPATNNHGGVELKSARRVAMLGSMSTPEDASPLAATSAPSASPDAAAPTAGAEPVAAAEPGPATPPADALSPAVRRLVRQFDLDITGIHGTGPEGRIRVGDVIGMLGGRTDSGVRDAPPRALADGDDTVIDPLDDDAAQPVAETPPAAPLAHSALATVPTTTVFDCDLSRVLAHRKSQRRDDVELLLTSYFLVALAEALETTPELAAGTTFGVLLTTTDGQTRSLRLDGRTAPASRPLDERLRTIDAALRANVEADIGAASLLVHHYGESGSLLATPTPLGAGHVASAGIGRVRREIVVRTIDGIETPRVCARCYLSLSFLANRVAFDRANRFVAHAVRVLEQWPD